LDRLAQAGLNRCGTSAAGAAHGPLLVPRPTSGPVCWWVFIAKRYASWLKAITNRAFDALRPGAGLDARGEAGVKRG